MRDRRRRGVEGDGDGSWDVNGLGAEVDSGLEKREDEERYGGLRKRPRFALVCSFCPCGQIGAHSLKVWQAPIITKINGGWYQFWNHFVFRDFAIIVVCNNFSCTKTCTIREVNFNYKSNSPLLTVLLRFAFYSFNFKSIHFRKKLDRHATHITPVTITYFILFLKILVRNRIFGVVRNQCCCLQSTFYSLVTVSCKMSK